MLLEELGLPQMENLDKRPQKSKEYLPQKEEEEPSSSRPLKKLSGLTHKKLIKNILLYYKN